MEAIEARVTKLEVFVEIFREELDRLQHGQEQLRTEIAALREHTDRGFAELRKEIHTNTRWVIGLLIANMTFTIVLISRLPGVH